MVNRPPPGMASRELGGQIDDDLVELSPIKLDRPQTAAVFQLEVDFLADQPTQQCGQLVQGFGHVELGKDQRLLA